MAVAAEELDHISALRRFRRHAGGAEIRCRADVHRNPFSNSQLRSSAWSRAKPSQKSTTPWSNSFVFSLVPSVPLPQSKYMLAKQWRERRANTPPNVTGESPFGPTCCQWTLFQMDPSLGTFNGHRKRRNRLPMDRPSGFSSQRNGSASSEFRGSPSGEQAAEAACATVEISPPDIVGDVIPSLRRYQRNTVEATSCESIEYRFRAARHLLAVCEQGARSDGDTFVEGLPKSSLRDLKKKLTFVPAGHGDTTTGAAESVVALCISNRSGQDANASPGGRCGHAPEPAVVLRGHDAMGYGGGVPPANRSAPGCDNRPVPALGVVLAHELVVRRRESSGGSSGAGRPRGLAAADRDLVYRGTSFRADPARQLLHGSFATARIIFVGPSSNLSECRRFDITIADVSAGHNLWQVRDMSPQKAFRRAVQTANRLDTAALREAIKIHQTGL